MLCPKCGGNTAVVDVCHNDRVNETYRKRRCKQCNQFFYTAEISVDINENFKNVWWTNHRQNSKGNKNNEKEMQKL